MAKFLNTSGVSFFLEELIKRTKDKLILVSPYLQFNDRIKEHIQNLNIQKKDIRIVYRENKLHQTKTTGSQIKSVLGPRSAKIYMPNVTSMTTRQS